MKRIALISGLMALLLVTAGPALGGYHYKARTWTEGENATEIGNLSFEAYIDGLNAAILFHESGNPFIKEGSRLVTTDAGRTFQMVDDENKTYSDWDLDAWVSSIGNVMRGLGPLVKIKIENPEVETLVREPGGTIAGQLTEHYKVRTSYYMKVKVFGLGQKQHVESVQDTWVTDAIEDAAISAWIERDPPDLGDPGFNELVRLEMEKNRGGFPMKTIVEQVQTNKKGGETTNRTITLVDLFEKVSVSSKHFEIDSDYQRVAASPLGGMQAETPEGEEEGEETKKGRFKRLIKRDGR